MTYKMGRRGFIGTALLLAGCAVAPTLHEQDGLRQHSGKKIREVVYVTDLLANPGRYKGREIAVKGIPYAVESAKWATPELPAPIDLENSNPQLAERQRDIKKAYINQNVESRTMELIRKGESGNIAVQRAVSETQANIRSAEALGTAASYAIVSGLEYLSRTLYNMEPDKLTIVLGSPKTPDRKLICNGDKASAKLIARIGNEIVEGDDILLPGHFNGRTLDIYEVYVDRKDPTKKGGKNE